MTDFDLTYDNVIRPNEGFFYNDPIGGLTYAGIAEKIFPEWEGFSVLHNYISIYGMPKNNLQFPELDEPARQFFQALWDKNRFGEIKSRKVRDIYFDWFVNTIANYAKNGVSTPVMRVQKLVGLTGDDVDGKQGPKTIAAINSVNADKLYQAIYNARQSFYIKLAQQGGDFSRALQGWLNRLSKFQIETTAGLGAVIFLVLLILIYTYGNR